MPEEESNPYSPPSNSGEDHGASSAPARSRKGGCVLSSLLLIVSGIALYFALFWGWASDAGSPPNAEELKSASNLAAGVFGALFLAAVFIMIFTLWKRR